MRERRLRRVLPRRRDLGTGANPSSIESDTDQKLGPSESSSKSGRKKPYLVGARFDPAYRTRVEAAIADAGSILGRPVTMQDAIGSLVEEAFQGDRSEVGRRIADLIARSHERENEKVQAAIAEDEER